MRLLVAVVLVLALALFVVSTVALVPTMLLADEPRVEATSLLGKPLYAPDLEAAVSLDREAKLAEALLRYKADPSDADNIIWLGRRTAYLGRYQEAIGIFSEGVRVHREDARMYRHRGHRYITTRQLDRAINDFRVAAALVAGKPDEVEPDGLPNAQNVPTSTLQSNIWYHLGLAYYLKGQFENALECYEQCLEVSKNADMWCATAYWLYMTARRLDAGTSPAIADHMPEANEIIENHTYYRLLTVFLGERGSPPLKPDDDLENATYMYGVGNWSLINGEAEAAGAIFENILDNPQWAAFGYIAAEAEIARARGE